MSVKDFALPDLGEGLTESELVTWHVAIGDTVELNQVIADVETAKALVELPSPFAGVIAGLYAEEGTTVVVGAPIASFEVVDDSREVSNEDSPAAGPVPSTPVVEREPVLVGYGPPIEGGATPKRRARTFDVGVPIVPADSVPVVSGPTAKEQPRSTPPVRKLARDLGIDLAAVAGTGEGGLVSRHDIERAAASESLPEVSPKTAAPGLPGARETRTAIRGVRKHTAAAMVASAFGAPQASEFLTIDVTPTMDLVTRLREKREFVGIRLSLLAVVAKALCISVARTPSVNSRWDDAAEEIIQYGYVNLGIAAATPRGLIVPNIPDADRLSLAELASSLTGLIDTARSGKSSPTELSGGTISITNIGVFGIDAGTPILNLGEAMILAMGAVRRMPWEHKGEIALRQVMTLSISFDHRLVDGEQASRFLSDIGAILADPGILLTMV